MNHLLFFLLCFSMPSSTLSTIELLNMSFPIQRNTNAGAFFCCNRDTMITVEVKFGGQALLFAPVTAGNPKHRKYDRSATNMTAISREFIARIKQEAPPMLRNHVIFEMLHAGPKTYLNSKSPSFCVNVSRHQPIVPYRHLLTDVWSFLISNWNFSFIAILKCFLWSSSWEFRSHCSLFSLVFVM